MESISIFHWLFTDNFFSDFTLDNTYYNDNKDIYLFMAFISLKRSNGSVPGPWQGCIEVWQSLMQQVSSVHNNNNDQEKDKLLYNLVLVSLSLQELLEQS